MKSLPTLLYLLLRDGITVTPTTLADAIERTEVVEEPVRFPELLPLAERLAAKLEGAGPTVPAASGPTDEELRQRRERSAPAPRPRSPDAGKRRVSEETKEQVRRYIRERGGRVTPGELDSACGFSSQTRGTVLRELREEGFCTAEYEGRQRVIVLASPPDPDGSTPGAAASPPSAPSGTEQAAKEVRGDGHVATPPSSSGGAEEDSAPSDDVPPEKTPHSSPPPARRPPLPAPRRRAPEPETEREPPPLGGKLNLKPKAPDTEDTVVTDEAWTAARSWIVGQRSFRRRQLSDAVPSLGPGQLRRVLLRASAEGLIEMRGERGGAHYIVKGGVDEETSSAPGSSDGGTLEGRLMEMISGAVGGMTQEQLAARAGTSVVVALGKLRHEGMVRLTVGPDPHYVSA